MSAERAGAIRDLKEFNRLVSSSPELSRLLVEGEHDYLQWFQSSLYESFRARRRSGGGVPARDGFGGLRGFLAGFAALAISAAAFLSALARRPRVIVFGIDKSGGTGGHDFRVAGLYRFLEERSIRYLEVLHSMLGREATRNIRKRGRAAVYQEALGFLCLLVPWRRREPARLVRTDADPFIRALAADLIRQTKTARCWIGLYRLMLKSLKPEAVLSIDDTRHYHSLAAAARSLGIPFYAFQHGHFTKYHPGWLDSGVPGNKTRPDALFVWSPYWKEELLRLGTYFKPDEIRVGGNPKGPSSPAPRVPAARNEKTALGVLLSYETGSKKDEVRAYARKLAETDGIRLFFSVRPDRDAKKQLDDYGLSDAPSGRVTVISGNLEKYLPAIGLAAGTYSTFLYDLVEMGVPVAMMETSNDAGEGMLKTGLADSLKLEEVTAPRLKEIAERGADQADGRRERYVRGSGDIMKTLEGLLMKPGGKQP